MAGQVYEQGDVLIDGVKIKAVGENIQVEDNIETIDAKGMWVMPGMVDPHCHIGMWKMEWDLKEQMVMK